jgi:GNAT superfamily N-acetyltransferase
VLELRPLTTDRFEDFGRVTAHGDDGEPCWCAFWHTNPGGTTGWKELRARHPTCPRDTQWSRVVAGFHVGALAYRGDALVGWLGVAPLPEVFWAWRRVAALGPSAGETAGITCFTLLPTERGHGVAAEVLAALPGYARARGWRRVEAYPFADAARRSNPALAWAGAEQTYRAAGFGGDEPHWLSRPGFERAIVTLAIP